MSKRLMLKLLKLGYYLLQIKTLMERRSRSGRRDIAHEHEVTIWRPLAVTKN